MTIAAKKRPRAQSSVIVGLESEWTDYRGVQMLFGIRRSLAYHLAKLGVVKSISVLSPTKQGKRKSERGKRLFHVHSFRRYLNSKIEAEGQR